MFRKGGNVGNGIMSGITDRVQAKEGFAAGFQGMGKNIDFGLQEQELSLIHISEPTRPY